MKSLVSNDNNNQNQIILIYSLKDTGIPVLRFDKGELEDI